MDNLRFDSFSQYYIRKLLRQYIKAPHSRISTATNISRYFNTNLDLLVADTCLIPTDLPNKLQELEMLIQVHHQTPSHEHATLFGLEQKILSLVGLKLYSLEPPMLLELVEEQQVSRFKFIFKQEIRRGARYRNEIYGFFLESKFENDPRTLKLIFVLLELNIPFIVTHSPKHYAVWLNLRSPAYSTLINDNLRLIHKVLTLRHKLQRLKQPNLSKLHHPQF